VRAIAAFFKEAGLATWQLPELKIDDTEAFTRAGGVLPTMSVVRDHDALIAKLAAATPTDGAEILKELGINWEA
jgi:hypothetical protein